MPIKTSKLLPPEAVLAWGYEWEDGELVDSTRADKPRKTGKNRYNDALIAVGAKAVRVRIIREKDYSRLLRAALRRNDGR